MRALTLLLFIFSNLIATAQTQKRIIYFNTNSASPNDSALAKMNLLKQELSAAGITNITVTGYADSVGVDKYNLELSHLRANTVAGFLKTMLPLANITAAYKGEQNAANSAVDFAYNRRVEIEFTKQELSLPFENTTPPTTQLQPFTEDVETQIFNINLNDTVLVKGKDGTVIKISPISIQTKKGVLMQGNAQLILKEYYNPGDIILSGMHSVADSGLLQTAGMFYVTIVQGKDSMSATTLKPVEIKMPDNGKIKEQMSVFNLKHSSADSTVWTDTRNAFKQVKARWIWPDRSKKTKLHGLYYVEDYAFNNMQVGRKYTEETQTGAGYLIWINDKRTKAKYFTAVIEKIDSVTVKVTANFKFRRSAINQFGVKEFDTTFFVKKEIQQYEVLTSNINFINCDRFYDVKNKTKFYINTPAFANADVMVYFKSLNAYMPANKQEDYYYVNNVPVGEDVSLIAIGKKGEEIYVGKTNSTITKKAKVDVQLKKMTEEEMEKFKKSL